MLNKGLKAGLWLSILGLIILAAGLASAIAIDDMSASGNTAIAYQVVRPGLYPMPSEDTKQHEVDMEVIGGRAAVVVDELNRKLNHVLTGKRLAWLMAVASLILALRTFLAAWRVGRRS